MSLNLKLPVASRALLFGLIVYLSLLPACHASPPWTPEDFDWSSLPIAPRDQWAGRYLNLTKYPLPNHPKIAALMEVGEPGQIDGTDVLFIPFILGLAWQAFNVAVTVGSVVTAVQPFKAAKAAGWLAKANNGFGGSGIENITLDVFQRRTEELYQAHHDDLMRCVLGGFSADPVEFLGYAPEAHRLARRGAGHLHPFAPVFRFTHPTHGVMDIVSREHANSTRFTVSYAAQDTHPGLGRRQSFQHETLSTDLFEGRFDGGVEAEDPGADFDAASGYPQIENTLKCFAGTFVNGAWTFQGAQWDGSSVLSGQMFDNSAQETFAFGSMGIFSDDSADGPLEGFTPQGMPFTSPSC